VISRIPSGLACCRTLCSLAEREFELVEFLLAVPVGPPETRILDNELGEFSRGQRHAALARRYRECFVMSVWSKLALSVPARATGCVLSIGTVISTSARRSRVRAVWLQPARREGDASRCCQNHGLPDSCVAVADRRNPIPAFGGDERRAIEAHVSRHFAGTPLMDCSCGMPGWGGVRRERAEQFVSPGCRTPSHQHAANKRAGNRAQVLSI